MAKPKPTTPATIGFRHPSIEDGADIWRTIRDQSVLDLNSSYAYLLLCDRFSQSCLIAEADGKQAGFLVGFEPPQSPGVLFVWQISVNEEFRGLGIAQRMIEELVRRRGFTAVEATVTPSNSASRRLFRSFAERMGCPCQEQPHFQAKHFPDQGIEAEDLFHIGPIKQTKA